MKNFIVLALILHFLSTAAFAFDYNDGRFDPGQITFRSDIRQQNERIDPFTGKLTLSYDDLVLPGDGNLDVSITRTYQSSKLTDRKWRKTTMGYGWEIHFGILKYSSGIVYIELQDGTQSVAYKKDGAASDEYITKDFWHLYMPSSGDKILTLSDGTKITFGQDSGGGWHYATRIARGSNSIDITYETQGSIREAVKTVSYKNSGSIKNINFHYTTTGGHIASISWGPQGDEKSIVYSYTSNDKELETVTFPEGDKWQYTYKYESLNYENPYILETVTTPQGGAYQYTFGTINKPCGFLTSISMARLIQKIVNDGANIGTWNYEYESIADDADYTTITDSNDRIEEHRFYGINSSEQDSCYKYGLPKSKNITDGNLEENTDFTWSRLPDIISRHSYSAYCACGDDDIFVPVLTQETTSRDGTQYATSYSDFDDHANPRVITETGSNTRTVTKTYWKNTERNMVKDFPESVIVSGDSTVPGIFTTNYEYHDNLSYFGKIKKISKYGVPTFYFYDANANLSRIEDANGNVTDFTWSNGTINQIDSGIYTVNREINWDGTVKSETDGEGYTTSYQYDGNMRLTRITPPIGNPTSITYMYDSNGYMVEKRKTRGSFSNWTLYDGIGRADITIDSLGVENATVFKANGLKNNTTSNIGDTVFFDGFERIERVLHQDNTERTYQYANDAEYTIYDEDDNPTTFSFLFFGDPGEKHLSSVKNPRNEISRYKYNTLGSLTETSRGGVVRTFHYDASNLMDWESHPESGTTSYSRYPNGNLKTKTENGITITYQYDALDRLKEAVSGSYSQNFWYDNRDNITRMTSEDVEINQVFDAANRLSSRSSIIKGKSGQIEYTYDNNDNITTISYPSKLSVNYDYNGLNQVIKVDGFGGSLTDINYYTTTPKIGLLQSYQQANGQSVSFSWDARRRMYTSRNHVGTTDNLKLDFRYDSRGNMVQLLRAGKNQSFGYDSLNRVISADGPWGSGSYTYDTADNRSTKQLGGTSTTYNYSSNRISSETGREYEYSGGNVTRIGNYYLSYDPFDNIHTSMNGSTIVGEYRYDAQNNRVYKKAEGETVYYHYGQSGNVLSELSASGVGLADYIYLNDMLVAKSASSPVIIAPLLLLLLDDEGGEAL